jgi:hypothetical protein
MFRAHRIVLVATLTAGAAFTGCNCAAPPAEPVGRASLIAHFTAGNTVPSDGQTKLEFTLTALNKNHAADLNPITITAPPGKGFLAKHGDTNVKPDTLTVTPSAQGSLDVDFLCTTNLDETVPVTATNTDASATVVVTCTAPQGQLVINVDDTDCTSTPASTPPGHGPLVSDGQSSCTLKLDVHTNANGVNIPFTANVTVKVQSAAVLDPTTQPNSNVLAPDTTTTTGQQQLVLTPDATGKTSFVFLAPNVAETATLEIDASTVSVTHDVVVGSFTNQGSLTINPPTANVTGGNPVTLTVIAVDAHGNPAAGGTVNFTVTQAGCNATTATSCANVGGAASGTLTLDATGSTAGTKNVTIATVAVTAPTAITFKATFDPGVGSAISSSATITANEAGALVLNVSPSPATLKSTDPTQTSTTLTVSFTKDSAAVPGGTVECVIPTQSTALIEFSSGNKTDQTISTFDATGNATLAVQVVPPAPGQEPVPTSTASVICTGTSGTTTTTPAQVNIPITRDPLLQNIIFVGVNPTTVLGVQGSNLPATATVQFQLLDDTGKPIPNVTVSFSKNATADPGISVLPSAVSDATGSVQTVLSTGTSPGPVTVIAEATVTDSAGTPILDANGFPVHKFAQSAAIPIVGFLPSFETSSFDCAAPASFAPYTATCTARLVDRFSNAVPKQVVQFLAEAGGTVPDVSTDDNGFAQITIKGTDEFRPQADVSGWSYGAVVPLHAGDLTADANFTQADINACFDGNSATPCNLLKLCNDPLLAVFCPLPNFSQCQTEANNIVSVLTNPPPAFKVATDATTAAQVAEYVAHTHDCGFPLSCLVGIPGGAGLDATDGDQCPVSLGCMDFDPTTPCQQDDLRSLTAATRGAEAFTDTNGNGRFDFTDLNHDGIMEQNEAAPACANCTNEPFVDLPEPFLDRNDNCSRDDFTNVSRFDTRPILKVENTDQFVDVDGNQVFGFTVGSAVQTTNGVWDPDTQIFHTAHVLELTGQQLKTGELCGNPGGNHVCQDGSTHLCEEQKPGFALAACPARTLAPPSVTQESIDFTWRDENGNCPSPGFASSATVTSSGPITVVGDVAVTLDQGLCGFAEASNPTLPFCSSVTDFGGNPLGSPHLSLQIAANCQPTNNPPAGTITFTLNGLNVNVQVPVNCP